MQTEKPEVCFLCNEACDFGLHASWGSHDVYNIIDIAKVIADEEKPIIYSDEEGDWKLQLSDKGKGLLAKYNFVLQTKVTNGDMIKSII